MNTEAPIPRALLTRLAAYLPDRLPLTEREIVAMRMLQSETHTIRRGNNIVVQGRNYSGIYVLGDGFALRYKVLSDGKRQVFHVALPGDLIGYPACFFEHALYSATALTEVTAFLVKFSDLAEIFRSQPRVAMALFWAGAGETAMYGEHLAAVGRRGALERVAHFILEMSIRLRAIGIGDGLRFSMPLTQEHIADVVGLSAPHVNRMLRRLREDGLIDITESQIRLLDRASLAALADFDDLYLARRFEIHGAATPVSDLSAGIGSKLGVRPLPV